MEFFTFKFVYLVGNVIFGHIVRIEHKKTGSDCHLFPRY